MAVDYMSLGLPVWTLFACTRMIMWGALLSPKELEGERLLCETVKTSAYVKYCAVERALDWNGWLQNYPGFDYANAPANTSDAMKNILAEGSQSEQYRCIAKVRGDA